MTLARSLPESPAEWTLILGAFAFYLLGRWFFAWRQARADGQRRPASAALNNLGEDDTSISMLPPPRGHASWKEYGRFVLAALLIALIALLTDGALRVILMVIVVPLLVTVVAYLDFRESRNRRSEEAERAPDAEQNASAADARSSNSQ